MVRAHFLGSGNSVTTVFRQQWRKVCNIQGLQLPESVTTVILSASRLVPLVLLGLGVAASMTTTMANAADVDFESCSIGGDNATLVGECASLDVPLDHGEPEGKKISLAIARIKANRRSTSRDPLTIIAGGPGQSAIESFAAVAPAFRHILKDRDLILIDQRGTGSSHPLECDAAPDSAALELDPDLDKVCLLYTSPSPRDRQKSRMPSSA